MTARCRQETLPTGADSDIRSRLVAAAGKVRHPALVLSSFTTGLAEVSRDEDDDELADAVADDSVPEEERERARLRRAALLVAALDIVDWCIDDLRASAFGMNGLPDPEDAEESFVLCGSRSVTAAPTTRASSARSWSRR
jgi:hypothetical protein